ncbi:hypothetical protein ACFLTE_06265, partial [Bacteroidota bacterium]
EKFDKEIILFKENLNNLNKKNQSLKDEFTESGLSEDLLKFTQIIDKYSLPEPDEDFNYDLFFNKILVEFNSAYNDIELADDKIQLSVIESFNDQKNRFFNINNELKENLKYLNSKIVNMPNDFRDFLNLYA